MLLALSSHRLSASMLEEIRNNVDFFIRNTTKFSRKDFIEKDEALLERNRLENLYTEDILNQFFTKEKRNHTKILDIGCKNWFYAKGEYDFFKSFCSNFSLDGVELDAHRLYSNFYSRIEVAKFYTKNLKNTKYIAGDLLELEEKYDFIIWILPFVTPSPLKLWGLPGKYFCPKKLLDHAFKLLNNNGQMLIINQGENEALIQQELLKDLKIPFTPLGEIKSEHFEYQHPRFGYLVKKQG